MSNAESLPVTIAVLNITPTTANRVVALADVEVVIEGIALVVHGVQLRADSNGTEVTLPRYRAADGSWRAAITLPEEVRGPMGDAVIAAGLEAGLVAREGGRTVATRLNLLPRALPGREWGQHGDR